MEGKRKCTKSVGIITTGGHSEALVHAVDAIAVANVAASVLISDPPGYRPNVVSEVMLELVWKVVEEATGAPQAPKVRVPEKADEMSLHLMRKSEED